MSFNDFYEVLYQNIIDSSWLEIIAASFGLISVWYAKKANILVYPTGIISVLIYVYICFNSQLYADMGINAYYLIFSVYGWIMWSRKGENSEEKPVTFCNKKNCILAFFIFLLSIAVIILLLKFFKSDDIKYWSTNIPYIDTFTTSIFIIGMWLMALKKVENISKTKSELSGSELKRIIITVPRTSGINTTGFFQ